VTYVAKSTGITWRYRLAELEAEARKEQKEKMKTEGVESLPTIQAVRV
jgi:hypothetical protein